MKLTVNKETITTLMNADVDTATYYLAEVARKSLEIRGDDGLIMGAEINGNTVSIQFDYYGQINFEMTEGADTLKIKVQQYTADTVNNFIGKPLSNIFYVDATKEQYLALTDGGGEQAKKYLVENNQLDDAEKFVGADGDQYYVSFWFTDPKDGETVFTFTVTDESLVDSWLDT